MKARARGTMGVLALALAAPLIAVGPAVSTEPVESVSIASQATAERPHRPRPIFPGNILVAYYGTAHTGSLGVLGETSPRVMVKRLKKAARPFGQGGKHVRIVFELIASVADASAGTDHNYSHFIPDSYVREYIRAAKRYHALLVLDIQPGRSDFLPQARHFGWALRKPWVGLALDPEWRMGPHQVPGRQIGSVRAAEVNRVSTYVSRIVRNHHLPQKLFMLHQFRTDMIKHIERVRLHKELATVQHVDGFGTRRQKLATFHNVVRPNRFHLGFKLFYDEDINRFQPRQVLHIRPRVQFVSYQ